MRKSRPLVVFSIVGSVLDGGGRGAHPRSRRRWDRWRPSLDVVQHPEMPVARLELLHQPEHHDIAAVLTEDIAQLGWKSMVRSHPVVLRDPWDFEEVYGALYDFCAGYSFKPDDEDYVVNITTGTHVAQICWFLLAESRHMPARLLQASPPKTKSPGDGRVGTYSIIDLDVSRYDKLRKRFAVETKVGLESLKQGVATKDTRYNQLMAELEQVASLSTAPLLLQGPTGTGKTQLARRIYELKRARRQVEGPFVEVNCATLRGDAAMSTLFGHKKGAFTGATEDREGLLKRADGGVLFLDEVGELGLDEQAMLLRAIEEKRFMPMGADKERSSQFQLLCGTHRDLHALVHSKQFREDLLARLDVWSFALPSLQERRADVPANLDVELQRVGTLRGTRITINKEARGLFEDFAMNEASWPGNFREFGASVERMATLCEGGRIGAQDVAREVERKRQHAKRTTPTEGPDDGLDALLGDRAQQLDPFDRVQLAFVVSTCKRSRSMADAGRKLFAVSRSKRTSNNDTDRLRKYLQSHGLSFDAMQTSDAGDVAMSASGG
jgi:transcriptional regulatory protein RtcR